MGQARARLLRAGHPVMFDFGGLAIVLNDRDRNFLTATYGPVTGEGVGDARATRHLLVTIAQAAFPQGMARVDRKTWAAWLEVIEDEAATVEVTRGMVEWLQKLAVQEDLRLPAGIAQWSEALVEYLDELLAMTPAAAVAADPA
jgi:hypothetical protein